MGTYLAVARLHHDRLDASRIEPTWRSSANTGRVVSSVNLPLADVSVRQVIGARLGVPVFVDNDASVAALAEAHDEHLRPVADSLVMLTIGTGVGGGLVLAGRIYRGATGAAGELAVQAARDGDPVAAYILEIWAERVGIGIANAINTRLIPKRL
jgi:predicted NBD/HSP70 family sugar kinase